MLHRLGYVVVHVCEVVGNARCGVIGVDLPLGADHSFGSL
jgi:hypothetical protein